MDDDRTDKLNMTKKKILSFFGPRKMREETVVNIRTIADIPPIIDVRQKLGNGNYIGAINSAMEYIENDISKFFNVQFNKKYTTLFNLYKQMVVFEKDISPDIIIDKESFVIETSQIPIPKETKEENLLSAIRKFGIFIYDVYNPMRYARKMELSIDDVVKRMVDIYSYMDLKELYFPDSRTRR
ncbi:MAG: hypothetical protein M1460_03940 [Candidatus Thermoplasmatota archaeon]|jgi:hypothetical protein|nr:hypothetical protein [Candidatus Thermoplasmatota archaeon]